MMTFVFAILLTTLDALAQTDSHRRALEYPAPTIREEQTVIVNGVPETWRLQWQDVPTPYCEPSEDSLMCPCIGFAYGETGDLSLVRLRNGIEIDRLHLTPLFREEPAVVQRWPADYDRDLQQVQRSDFSKIVSNRPTVQVMNFGDFNHDGQQTEFYLQTEAVPCGKSMGIVVGLSERNPRLHAFGTSSHPNKPLYLQRREWEKLRDAATGPIEIIDWNCGDHGADTQTVLRLHWSANGIDGVRREYTCSSNKGAGRLIHEKPIE
jgi:hypothetical protein